MLGLTGQELTQYAAPLVLGVIVLAVAVLRFIRGQKLQQQLNTSQTALLSAQQQLHEQDTELQVLGSQQDQLHAQLQRREADYQQLYAKHRSPQEQLLQVRGVADAARAAYRELKEQQLLREKALTEQQASYLELQQTHQNLQQEHVSLRGLTAQKEQHLLEQQQLLKDKIGRAH